MPRKKHIYTDIRNQYLWNFLVWSMLKENKSFIRYLSFLDYNLNSTDLNMVKTMEILVSSTDGKLLAFQIWFASSYFTEIVLFEILDFSLRSTQWIYVKPVMNEFAMMLQIPFRQCEWITVDTSCFHTASFILSEVFWKSFDTKPSH